MPKAQETPDGSTVQDLLSKGHPFKPVDTVSLNAAPDELLQKIQDHQRDGLPLVITGLNTDPGWPYRHLSDENLGEEKVQSEEGQGIIWDAIFAVCS